MRIALTADPELPVPPRFYGGIERVIDMLGRELTARGHEVVLFANRDSTAPGRLVSWPGSTSSSVTNTLLNAATLAHGVIGGDFDIVHSFSRIAYLTPLLPLSIPKLMTYQREINPRTVALGHKLSRGSLAFSAIGHHMLSHVSHLARWFMVPNGVPLDIYDFQPVAAPDAPLVFLGRLEEIKGPHLAIDIAKRTGRKLILAGNIPAEHQGWFDAMVAPNIDGTQITYVGPIDDVQKNLLLGQALAFLMPILWEEPFGIVMAEALACGTPVLGLRRGAAPEIIEDGVTGFVAENVDELVHCVGRLGEIKRADCRERARRFYSAAAVTDGYLDVYNTLISG